MTRHVLPANDPLWSDEAFRTAKLRGLIALHGLKGRDLCRLTDKDINIVRHWMSGKYRTIPTDTIRALEYELLFDRQAALGGD